MNLALIVLLGLSAVVDLALGAWASVSWRSFADVWFSESVKTQMVGPGPQLLGLVLGLMLIGFAVLQGLAIRWIRNDRDAGYHVVYFFAAYLVVSSVLTTVFLPGRDLVLMGWPLFLLVDGVRGACLGALAYLAQREPSTISKLRLPSGHQVRTSGSRSASGPDSGRRERRSRRPNDRSGRGERRGGRGRKRREPRRGETSTASARGASGSSGRSGRSRRSSGGSGDSGSGEKDASTSRPGDPRRARGSAGPVNRARSATELIGVPGESDGTPQGERSLAVVVKGARPTEAKDNGSGAGKSPGRSRRRRGGRSRSSNGDVNAEVMTLADAATAGDEVSAPSVRYDRGDQDSRRSDGPVDVLDVASLLDEPAPVAGSSDDHAYGRSTRPSRSRRR